MSPIFILVDAQLLGTPCWKRALGMCACECVETLQVAEKERWRHLPSRTVAVIPISDSIEAIRIVSKIQQMNLNSPVLLIVREGSEQLAVAAFRAGVSDYFHLPEEEMELAGTLRQLTGSRGCAAGQAEETETSKAAPLIGCSARFQAVRAHVSRFARSNSNVLITGETGTGKEVVASAIHRMSDRREKPFVCVNCAAIPDALVESELFGYERGAFTGAHARKAGLLEAADQGTLFMDEVGDMSLFTQAKLLRILENKQFHRLGGKTGVNVNVRFIAATNRNLEQMAKEGKFRQDLYYRLNIARIHLPPLRDRKEDISLLLRHYIQEFKSNTQNQDAEFSNEVWDRLMAYEWPGNIRELKNLIEAVFVNSPPNTIYFEDLPEEFRKTLEEGACANVDERQQLLTTLLHTNWNKSKAAEQLHWSRMTLYRKMHKYHISAS